MELERGGEHMGFSEQVQDIAAIFDRAEQAFLEDPGNARGLAAGIRAALDEAGAREPFNVIPGGTPGDCRRLLVVMSAAADLETLERLVGQAGEHVQGRCKNVTREVLFWAPAWDVRAWAPRRKTFSGVAVALKLFGAGLTLLR